MTSNKPWTTSQHVIHVLFGLKPEQEEVLAQVQPIHSRRWPPYAQYSSTKEVVAYNAVVQPKTLTIRAFVHALRILDLMSFESFTAANCKVEFNQPFCWLYSVPKFACILTISNPVFRWESYKGSV